MEYLVFVFLISIISATLFVKEVDRIKTRDSLSSARKNMIYTEDKKSETNLLTFYRPKEKTLVIRGSQKTADILADRILEASEDILDKQRVDTADITPVDYPELDIIVLEGGRWKTLLPSVPCKNRSIVVRADYKTQPPKTTVCIEKSRAYLLANKITAMSNRNMFLSMKCHSFKGGEPVGEITFELNRSCSSSSFRLRQQEIRRKKFARKPLKIDIDEENRKVIMTGFFREMKIVLKTLSAALEIEGKIPEKTVDSSAFRKRISMGFAIKILSPKTWSQQFPDTGGSYKKFFVKNYRKSENGRLTFIFERKTALLFKDHLRGLARYSETKEFRGYPYYDGVEKVQDTLVIDYLGNVK